jgi:hypothetical protein
MCKLGAGYRISWHQLHLPALDQRRTSGRQLSTEYTHITVEPSLPIRCLTPIEKVLLTLRFDKTEQRGEWIHFKASPDLPPHVFAVNEEIIKAVTESHELCPELCRAIAKETNMALGGLVNTGSFNYTMVLNGIVRRNSGRIPFLTIEESHCELDGACNGMATTVIRPGVIQVLSARGGSDTIFLPEKMHWSQYLRSNCR